VQTNTSMKLLSFTRNRISFALSVKGDTTPAVNGITVTHSWSDSPQVRGGIGLWLGWVKEMHGLATEHHSVNCWCVTAR
jgi:hypothetical protein